MAHPEQAAFCRRIRDRHPHFFHRVRVLDVGSLDINGSNLELFTEARYLGVDVAPGRNVDVVVPAHLLALPDSTFDVVISTECFEHDRHFADTLRNMYRMLKPGGLLLFTCATTGRPEHGTRATTPEDAPLLAAHGDWADYYQNVTEAMVRDVLDVDQCFSEYAFATNLITHDLYFHGVKPGPPLDKQAFTAPFDAGQVSRRLLAEEARVRELEHQLAIERTVTTCLESELKARERDLSLLRGSTSWKLTLPLRVARAAALHGVDHLGDELRRELDEVVGEDRLGSALRTVGQLAARLRARGGSSNKRAFTILTPPHTDFVAHCVARVLRQESFEVRLLRQHDGDEDGHHLVICPQVMPVLPERYFAFQMEQTVSPRWWSTEYLQRLRDAEAILDYSVRNLEFLQRLGIPYQQTFLCPIRPTHDYRRLLVEEQGYPEAALGAAPGLGREVIFYGDPSSDRRKAILEALQRHHPVRVVSGVFGAELVAILASARVVVNIHFYEGALLETTRLSEVLSLGVPVVSEEGTNPEEYDELRPLCDLVPIGDVAGLVAAVRRLVEDDELCAARRATVAAHLACTRGLDDALRRFLHAVGLIPLSSLTERTSLGEVAEADSDEAIPAICLSLPETPSRRRAFLAQRRPEFQIFDGLRHRTGWKGCGLSYKLVLGRAAGHRELLLVCEDDVEFPPDFETRWPAVKRYLLGHRGPWDVFSGLVSDVHEDTRVLAVTEHEGQTLVTLDRMTGMLFNVYAPRAMELVAAWNEANSNPDTNTIDRYLERAGALRVLTTLPFLVRHGKGGFSTLWGIPNTQYADLIVRSEKRLADKVAAFRAERTGAFAGGAVARP